MGMEGFHVRVTWVSDIRVIKGLSGRGIGSPDTEYLSQPENVTKVAVLPTCQSN